MALVPADNDKYEVQEVIGQSLADPCDIHTDMYKDVVPLESLERSDGR